jgi:hypothetical protein
MRRIFFNLAFNAVSFSSSPTNSKLPSQSNLCFSTSLDSLLLTLCFEPLRYSAFGIFPTTGSSIAKHAFRITSAYFSAVRRVPFGNTRCIQGVAAFNSIRQGPRVNQACSRMIPVLKTQPGLMERTPIFRNSGTLSRRACSAYINIISQSLDSPYRRIPASYLLYLVSGMLGLARSWTGRHIVLRRGRRRPSGSSGSWLKLVMKTMRPASQSMLGRRLRTRRKLER